MLRLRQERRFSSGKNFVRADRALDKARAGPQWLKEPEIASRVVAALYRGDHKLRQYALYSFVVMPNHVHVLLNPCLELERITNGLKGATAREANRVLGRTGHHFWQDESYDHWIRDSAQFDRVRLYIERNPVAAGLVEQPEDWPWSSASRTAPQDKP
ncbi:MAG TPA: transposase [Verrucomicrobiae bacterium]|jgi:putative transposase|nr:transposase [Verrucomicrobiae bacterium]